MAKKAKRFFKNFWTAFWRPEMLILPGQLAFFFILSIVPILTLIGYGASYLNLPMDFINTFLTKAFSDSIASLITPILTNNQFSLSFLITLLIGYFIASNGAASIIVTSNTIYGIKDKGFLNRRIKAMIMTLFIVFLFLFILIIPLFGQRIIELLKFVNFNQKLTNQTEFIINILNGPLSWLIIFFFIKVLYTMAPDKKISSRNVNMGAIFTSVGWIISTTIYSYYITNVAHYDKFYGGLSNLVILLLWFYLLAYIFVIGMAINNREDQEKLAETSRVQVINKEELAKTTKIKIIDEADNNDVNK